MKTSIRFDVTIVAMILIMLGMVMLFAWQDAKPKGTSPEHNNSSNITYQYDDRTHFCYAFCMHWANSMVVVDCSPAVIEQAIKDHQR